MTHDTASAYGLWTLVILNSAVFIIFAFSFGKPRSSRDWRSFSAFSAFVVALFAEMYGFPLTIYLLSGWLQTRYPGADPLAHNAGHLWSTMFGLEGDPHFSVLHILSTVVIGTTGYTIYSEYVNTIVRRSWVYTEWMPMLPRLGAGLSPLAQWSIVPAVALVWAGRALPLRKQPPSGRTLP